MQLSGRTAFKSQRQVKVAESFILQYKNSPTDIGWVSAPLVAGNGGVLVFTYRLLPIVLSGYTASSDVNLEQDIERVFV